MQNVDLGGDLGVVAFPDHYTPDDIIRDYENLKSATPPRVADINSPSPLDYAKNVGGRLLRGAAGMVASVPEDLAIAASGLNRLFGGEAGGAYGEGSPTKPEDRYSYQLGQAIRKGAEYIAPTDPRLNESFWASKVPEGVGSSVGFAAGGVAGRLLKVPAWATISVLGSASSGADFYNDAKANGADDATAQIASAIGNVVGTSEALPMARILHRLDNASGGTFTRALWESGKSTIEEALQEGVQQLAQNFTAQQLYDKDRSLLQDVGANAGVGGITGFLMTSLGSALGIATHPSRVRRAEERQSRDASSARIAGVIAQRESESNAISSGEGVTTPSQEEGVRQEAGGPLYLRGAPISGLETQTGTEVANAPVTQTPPPVTPGISVAVTPATVPEVAAPETTQGTVGQNAVGEQPLTEPKSVVQEAIDTLFTPQPQEAPIAFVGRVVRDVVSGWQNAPDIQLVDNGDQLPDDVRATAAAKGVSTNDIDGVRDSKGTVWIVADKVKDADHARRLLLHEAVGHEGVDRAFGTQQQWESFMQGVAARHAATPLGAEIRGIYGNDPLTVGKEIVAKLAENPSVDPTLWQQIVAAVRNWVRRVFKVDVSDNDIQALLMKARRAVEGQPVAQEAATGGTSFAISPETQNPSFFPRRSAVTAATGNPGLSQSDAQQAEDLAAVQAHMVTPDMVDWLVQIPGNKVEIRAKKILDYLLDRATVSSAPRPLGTLPEGTTEEQRTKQLAGAMQLAHHGVDRSTMANIYSDIGAAQVSLNEAMAKTTTTTQLQHKANFLTATFNKLTTDFRQYLVNLKATAPASGNLAAQFNDRLMRAEGRLNEHVQSSAAIKHALSAIARTVPDNLLVPTINLTMGSNVNAPLSPAAFNQPVVDWAIQNGALFGVVSDEVRDWLLTDDGTGQPALMSYDELLPDLQVLKDILNNGDAVQADIDAFEAWFKNAAAGPRVSAKDFAEKYFKFRTGRDRALKIVAATEKEIDRYDLAIRANTMARDKLETMMSDPAYRAAVLEAADKADVVINALFNPDKPDDPAIGLINRERSIGSWTLKGPIYGENFVVNLYPSAAGEAENIANLAAWAAEARAWALGHTDSDPLLAKRYNDLADEIEQFYMSPSLNPKAGFTQTRVRLPFSNIRISIDPFDGITAATGAIGYSFQTVRDVIERIGGRTMREAFRDAATLDTVMRQVDAIDHNPEYGRAAQTAAVLKAFESHGWTQDQSIRWDEQVAEPVLAAAQNRLSPGYDVGDVIVGSDTTLTVEDVSALKLMKRWGGAIINVAPHSIQDKLGELGISRRAIGNGKLTTHRVWAQWTENFIKAWTKAKDDSAKEKLLEGQDEFRRVVLGYLAEFNPEFGRMNPASNEKSLYFELYRRLAATEKSGVQTFRSMQEVIDFLAEEGVDRGVFQDYITAAGTIHTALLDEIKAFIKAFQDNVIGRDVTNIWRGVPDSIVKIISSNNSFTTPRGKLQAPSTFYSYSSASAARQQHHVGNLRSLLNLKLLQDAYEAKGALEEAKRKMSDRITELSKTMTKAQARGIVQKETAAARQNNEIRFDLREVVAALQAIEQAFGNVERYEQATTDHYQHAGVAAANAFFSAIKASLLSSTQAMSTNFWSGALLGPAIAHWQAGMFGRAMGDVVIQPGIMAKTVLKRVAAMIDNNPTMSRLLRQHAPMWDDIAQSIIKAAADWRRIQQIAQSSGMVNPYNLGTVLKNMGELKRSSGRIVHDDQHHLAEWVNAAMAAPGVRHVTETMKAATPRLLDNAINYLMIVNWDRETEILKKVGWAAFKNREDAAAATGADWKDLTKASNVLTPGDIGLRTNKALEWYRQLFSPLGSLDSVLLDYYERTKNMSPEQREAEPLLSPDDNAALALQYAAKSNVSTETNRPVSLKGKGSDGVWRNVVGTFMGWSINMMHQLSKGLQTHSGDKQFPAIANSMIGLFTIIALMVAVGAWNWEFGDELTKKLYDVSSARVQLGNIKDWNTALLYAAQAIVNTVPMIGSSIGGLFGVAYTGRGNPFDMSSLSPHIGFVSGIYNTVRRIAQTGDASLPLIDFTRQWVPMAKIIVNRLPVVRGLVDQQNAVRSLNASAPPGTEIKWGKRGGGDVKYGPASDEVTRLIAAAYEAAAHGGDPAAVQARLNEAIAAYVKAGRSPEDAQKALTSALSAKEPIRVLTGREMTPEEEARWVARMTKEQRADYDKAVAAWNILGNVTGKDFNMVTTKGQGGGGGGGGGSTASRAVGLGGGPLRSGLGAGSLGGGSLAGTRLTSGGLGGGRRSRGLVGTRTSRRRSSGITGGTSRRRTGPRVSRASGTRRRGVGVRRRRGYSTA